VTTKPADWVKPDTVSAVTVCRTTGKLPNELCAKDQVVSDLFAKGTEPKDAGDILVKAKAIQVTTLSADKKSTVTEWQLWQQGCLAIPVERTFIKRPTPRAIHPTDPYNPKYVPQDAKDELPTKVCQPGVGGLIDRLLPGQPGDGTFQPGTTQPGTTQPGTTQPGTTQPGTTQPGTGGQTAPAQPGAPTQPGTGR
jgi:hypothetical protein